MPDNASIDYINSTDFKVLERRLRDLDEIIEDNTNKSMASRKLRYADVDIEAEREEGRLQPDELYIPQHIIDTNIRREQSPYVQYIAQSTRAVICQDQDALGTDLSNLEADLTKKLRFDGWQLSMFANIDGFQSNGYSVMEVVYDVDAPGNVKHESVCYGDFAILTDTRDIQAVEMCERAYYFTKTRLLALCGDPNKPNPDSDWDRKQVQKILDSTPETGNISTYQETDQYNKSLFRIKKVMFRVNGIVHVAWMCLNVCDDWLRKPRPLYIGRRELLPQAVPSPIGSNLQMAQQLPGNAQGIPTQPPSKEQYETQFPYFLFPYLISENDTIDQLKGRVYLDGDLQEGVTSLVSSTITAYRRSAGLYFSKDVSDPNDDLMLQKNIFFRSGCLINSKVTQMQLQPPDVGIFQSINMLISGNQNETSQVNFAVNNRKDSRKTAKEISVASQQAAVLSTVQVVLFSLALKQMYTTMCSVITSRVKSGLIIVPPDVRPLYDKRFVVKPSGDSDVIEKQQLLQAMFQAWPVMSQTGAATPFLIDMISLAFPLNANKYIQAIQQAQQQQQSQQAQMLQQGLQMVKMMAGGIIKLSEHPDFFSDIGRIHAFPIVEHFADQIKQVEEMMKPKGKAGAGQQKQLGM